MRHLLPLGLLLLVPIFLAPAGSAKPPAVTAFTICVQDAGGSPSCSGTAPSSFDGNTQSTIQLSVTNSSSSTVSIGSADILVPDQLKVEQNTAAPSKYVSTQGQHILFTGINVPKGKSFTATFTADVACGGDFDWSMSQNAYGSSDRTGTPFDTYTATATTTTSITTECHLAFITQPTDTPNSTKLWVDGSSTGGDIKVGLFNGATGTSSPMSTCPVGYGSDCSVDLGSVNPQGDVNVGLTNNGTTDDLTQPLQADTNGHLVATFSDVQISLPVSKLPAQFDLTATGHGSFAPTVKSGSFLIADNVTPITCSQGSCSKSQQNLAGFGLTDSFADVNAVTNFNFMTLTPYTLGTVPDGCKGRKDLGVAGFAESDGRSGRVDTLTINFYVNYDNIKARYGANTGQQFIPICAGGRPVDANGVVHDCTDYDAVGHNSKGWVGDEINSTTGKFTGKPANAVCNADGYYWGILGSFQDKIPAGNPVVTGFGGATISGTNYRVFTMSIPPNWDWRSGP